MKSGKPLDKPRAGAGQLPIFNPSYYCRLERAEANKNERLVESDDLTPEQRLEPPNTRLINAGIATIHDMETLRACVAYENANQQRIQILRRLEQRASEIRSQDD